MKKIWVVTLFPDMFSAFLNCGVASKAFQGERGERFDFHFINPAEYSPRQFKGVDDAPFGGGHGMIMRADVLEKALLEGVVQAGNYGDNWRDELNIIFPCPRGVSWSSASARAFALKSLSTQAKHDLVFICGRYEGVDERFLEEYVNQFFSLGDYIVTGGELAVMAILDSAIRFVPEVLGNKASANEESFEDGLLEHPLYTRPRDFAGRMVPEALLSGDPKKIEAFYTEKKQELTKKYRPDLWEKHNGQFIPGTGSPSHKK